MRAYTTPGVGDARDHDDPLVGDIRAQLQAIKPEVDHGPHGYRALGMTGPMDASQAAVFLHKYQTGRPSAHGLDVIDKLGLRPKLIAMLTEYAKTPAAEKRMIDRSGLSADDPN